ncbi:hypothetical protein [Kribbella pittospori]|nr:hypothetical protein [Kribbella pittospori]
MLDAADLDVGEDGDMIDPYGPENYMDRPTTTRRPPRIASNDSFAS